MPYEKSDNTTNVVRPTLTKILQKKKDTPQHRKYVQKKVEQEQLRRLSQDPFQAQISQGRNYSAAEQKRRETASQRRGEIEQMHHDDLRAAETMHMAFAPFLLSNWVGAATTNNAHGLSGRLNYVFDPKNRGIFEQETSLPDGHPGIALGNLAFDVTSPFLIKNTASLLPKVGFQQGGLRIGNYVYRAPRYQLNMGVPVPERVPAIKEYTIDKAVKEQLSEQLSQKGKKFLGYASRDGGKTYNPMFEVSINGRTLKSFGKESLKTEDLLKTIAKLERYVEPPQELDNLKKLGLDFDESSWFNSRPKVYEATKDDIVTFYGHIPEYNQIAKDLINNGQMFKKGKKWYGIIEGQTVQLKDPESFIVSHSKAFLDNGYVYHNDNYATAVRPHHKEDFIKDSATPQNKDYPTWTSNNSLQNAKFQNERKGPLFRDLVANEEKGVIIEVDPKLASSTFARRNQIIVPNGPVLYGRDINGNMLDGLWRLFGPELKVKSLRGNNGNFADDAGLFSFIEIPELLSSNLNIV